jgi:hypothetical protein
MMPQSATRSNRQNCDGLRSCATPRGRYFPDFAGLSGHPLTAAVSINAQIDVICQKQVSRIWLKPRLQFSGKGD